MPTTVYKKPATKHRGKSPAGRSQHKSSKKGVQHRDYTNVSYFNATYGRNEPPVDLFKQTFRVTARMGGDSLDISGLVENLSWADVAASSASSGDAAMVYANTSPVMTGTVALRKPALSQYKQLLPRMFDASLEEHPAGAVSRFGALGVVIVCEVGYARSFTPVWAMRVQPSTTSPGQGAEEIDLQDGAWTFQLADDLAFLGMSVDDFKFTKGKRLRKKGWRAHEVAIAVAHQYGCPVAKLARGTAWHDFPLKDTSTISPLEMISQAYQEESYKTGKAYTVRWGAPTRKHPLGALEVVPMRRNPNLISFRDQLLNAVLTRSQRPGFASVITGRATLKDAHGKHQQITYTAKSPTAVRRFGFVHQIIEFKPVSSHLELKLLTTRALAFRLTPLRTADLTNPGIATIRRGDAIRIDVPEEGYADVALDAYGQPKPPRGKTNRAKYTALALKAAELQDPSMFGIPDPTLFVPTTNSAAQLPADPNKVVLADTPVMVPVADQSIAFVTGATHTVSSGNYTVEMQASFVDIFDPLEMKQEIEANIRNGKSLARASGQASSAAASVSGGGWVRCGATLDTWWQYGYSESAFAGHQACGAQYYNHGLSYAELLVAGANAGLSGQSLKAVLNVSGSSPHGGMPCGQKLQVRLPGGSKAVTIQKSDVGSGQAGNPHFKIDLHPEAASAIGWKPNGDVEVRVV